MQDDTKILSAHAIYNNERKKKEKAVKTKIRRDRSRSASRTRPQSNNRQGSMKQKMQGKHQSPKRGAFGKNKLETTQGQLKRKLNKDGEPVQNGTSKAKKLKGTNEPTHSKRKNAIKKQGMMNGEKMNKNAKGKSRNGVEPNSPKPKYNPSKTNPSVSKVTLKEENNEEEWSNEDNEEESTEEELSDGDNVIAVSGDDIGALCTSDSKQAGTATFQWIIAPHTEKEFFSKYWEKQPLYIPREGKDRGYFKGIFSTEDFDNILRNQSVLYTKNLDITSYSDGQRETHNPVGRAHPPVVWDYYNNGCSVRMLNPQTFHRPVWKILYNLQEYFNCFCGANVYLTPPDTQGFAPHWDDIEAFILQLEGQKHWKVYKPRTADEELPVNSSANLSQEEIGEPVLEVTLKPGDLLYFPRGYIHQGAAVDGHHSLHITVSTYQRNTWGHYLEKLLPQALSAAMAEDVEFRSGLPRNYLDVMGIVNMDEESPGRDAFVKKVGEMVTRMMQFAPLDATVDQRGSGLMHDALPPPLTPDENQCSARSGGERWCAKKQRVENRVELDPSTHIRLIKGNCLRIVTEGESVNLYHCLENTREYHQEEPQFLEVSTDQAPGVEALVRAYPHYLAIESLPLMDDTLKMSLAIGLWERGLLVTAQPLNPAYDD